MKRKYLLFSIVFALFSIFLLTACPSETTKIEISQYPDKIVYIAGIDTKLNFEGCKLTFSYEDGDSCEQDLDPNDYPQKIDYDIDFQTPGVYIVNLSWVDGRFKDKFPIQVISENYIDNIKLTSNEPEFPTLQTLSGIWKVTEFLGTTNVHTDEEDEEEQIGKELIIAIDEVTYDKTTYTNSPEIEVSLITYDDMLVLNKTEPEILGMKVNKSYYQIRLSDEPSESGVALIYVIDKIHLAYYRYSKYYLLARQ